MSQVISAFLLQNADTYCILELQQGQTEVLNKGGTTVGATLIEYFGLLPHERQNMYTYYKMLISRSHLK